MGRLHHSRRRKASHPVPQDGSVSIGEPAGLGLACNASRDRESAQRRSRYLQPTPGSVRAVGCFSHFSQHILKTCTAKRCDLTLARLQCLGQSKRVRPYRVGAEFDEGFTKP